MRHRSPIGQEASTTEKMLAGAKRRGHAWLEGPHGEALGPTGGCGGRTGVGVGNRSRYCGFGGKEPARQGQ